MSSVQRPNWSKKLERRKQLAKRLGLEKPCECWECLRADGITVSNDMRDRFPDVVDRVYGVEVKGNPVARRKPDEDGQNPKADPEEASHLRAAIANREVI